MNTELVSLQDVPISTISSPKMWDWWTTYLQNMAYDANHPADGGGAAFAGEKNHTLYAYVGRSRHLLYVGITDNPGQRMADHRRSSAWYRQAAAYYWTDQNCCRKRLRDMESMAIRMFNPVYNVQGKL